MMEHEDSMNADRELIPVEWAVQVPLPRPTILPDMPIDLSLIDLPQQQARPGLLVRMLRRFARWRR